jgi:preprotein translocase subunit YajC
MLDALILAQAGGGNSGGSSGGGLLGSPFFLAFMLALLVYMVLMARGQRKSAKDVQKMLANLKKNDRVMTNGGIIGSVVSVTPQEVVLKVDESANVKITFHRSAITQILSDESKPNP